MSLPQAVTNKYTHNLILTGSNDVFAVDFVQSEPNVVNGDVIGHYFAARVIFKSDQTAMRGHGATPRQAVRKALEKFGVTFK